MPTIYGKLTGLLGKSTNSYLRTKVKPVGYVVAELANDTWRSITATLQGSPVAFYALDAINFWRQATIARKYLKGLDIISEYHQHEAFWENGIGRSTGIEGVDEVDSTQPSG